MNSSALSPSWPQLFRPSLAFEIYPSNFLNDTNYIYCNFPSFSHLGFWNIFDLLELLLETDQIVVSIQNSIDTTNFLFIVFHYVFEARFER